MDLVEKNIFGVRSHVRLYSKPFFGNSSIKGRKPAMPNTGPMKLIIIDPLVISIFYGESFDV